MPNTKVIQTECRHQWVIDTLPTRDGKMIYYRARCRLCQQHTRLPFLDVAQIEHARKMSRQMRIPEMDIRGK